MAMEEGKKVTPVQTHVYIECECGCAIETSALNPEFVVECPECEKKYRRPQGKYQHFAEVFQLFGYSFSVDFDGQLLVESDGEIPTHVYDWIVLNQQQITRRIESDRSAAMRVFVGGSLNGQKHTEQQWGNRRVHRHIGRAHWETFQFKNNRDPRLWYVGRSTSIAKAKAGRFLDESKPNAS